MNFTSLHLLYVALLYLTLPYVVLLMREDITRATRFPVPWYQNVLFFSLHSSSICNHDNLETSAGGRAATMHRYVTWPISVEGRVATMQRSGS